MPLNSEGVGTGGGYSGGWLRPVFKLPLKRLGDHTAHPFHEEREFQKVVGSFKLGVDRI